MNRRRQSVIMEKEDRRCGGRECGEGGCIRGYRYNDLKRQELQRSFIRVHHLPLIILYIGTPILIASTQSTYVIHAGVMLAAVRPLVPLLLSVTLALTWCDQCSLRPTVWPPHRSRAYCPDTELEAFKWPLKTNLFKVAEMAIHWWLCF